MPILTKLKKEGFNKILENYNLGKHKSHRHIWWAMDNTVYILKTTKGKFVLKIFERADPKFIKYQIKTINFIRKKRLPVQEFTKTKSGKYLLTHNHKTMLIYKFIEGNKPKKYSKKLIKNIAKNLGLLNKNLLKLKLKGKYTWGKDYHFKPIKEIVGKVQGFNFTKEENLLLKTRKNIKKNKLRKSIIHGDFHGVNFLVKNDKLTAIIDWDDIHEDFLVFEPSVFIAHTFIKPTGIKVNQLKVFLKEYQKHVKLNLEEKKAIYYFVKRRYLGVIVWCTQQQKRHKEKRKVLDKWLSNNVKSYLLLNNIPIADFIKLF